MDKQKTCIEIVNESFESTMEDLDKLWKAYCEGNKEEVEDLGTFMEYGLSFDYVTADTFDNQEDGYFRYQISYGGPSTEFRFFTDATLELYKIEYWHLDWFDGAKKICTDNNTLGEIFDMFQDCGSLEAELEKATS